MRESSREISQTTIVSLSAPCPSSVLTWQVPSRSHDEAAPGVSGAASKASAAAHGADIPIVFFFFVRRRAKKRSVLLLAFLSLFYLFFTVIESAAMRGASAFGLRLERNEKENGKETRARENKRSSLLCRSIALVDRRSKNELSLSLSLNLPLKVSSFPFH